MIQITGALIELQSDAPERLADFYVRLAHLNVVSSKPELVVLVGSGVGYNQAAIALRITDGLAGAQPVVRNSGHR